MALIQCPECQKEISDAAANCPNCGYLIESPSEEQNNVPGAFVTQTPDFYLPANPEMVFQPKKSKTKILVISLISIVIVAAISIIAVQINAQRQEEIRLQELQQERQNYITQLNEFTFNLILSAAKIESQCNLIKNVWSDTIYKNVNLDTIKFTIKPDSYIEGVYIYKNQSFNDDFNVSLSALFADPDFIMTNVVINTQLDNITTQFIALSDPMDEFVKCYELAEELYDSYYKLSILATSPSGSLQTYLSNFHESVDQVSVLYNKLHVLVPDE